MPSTIKYKISVLIYCTAFDLSATYMKRSITFNQHIFGGASIVWELSEVISVLGESSEWTIMVSVLQTFMTWQVVGENDS